MGSRLLRFAVVIGLAAQLAAIWQVRHLPTQDGGAHVYNATLPFVWPNTSSGAASSSSVIDRYLEPRPTLSSWLPQRILGAAVALGGRSRAEHVVVSLYLVLFAAAARWVVIGVAPDNGSLAVLVAMLAMNYTLHMGFYGFCLSITAALVSVGLWLRTRYRLPARLAMLAVALLITHLLHPFGLVLAGVVCVSLSPFRRAGHDGRWRALLSDLALLMLAALPALVLFFRDLEPSGLGLAYLLPSPGRVIHRLTVEPDWIAYTNLEWVPFAAGLGVPALLALWHAASRWRRRVIARGDGFAIAAVIVGGMFLTVPEFMASGGFVTARLLLCAVVLAGLWVATSPWSPRWRMALASSGVAATIALAAINAASYRHYERLLDEQVRALSVVPPHATLLPLSVADSGVEPDDRASSNRPRPFRHAVGRIGAESDVLLFDNYQAEATHFPIRFKPGVLVPNQTTVDEFPWGDAIELPPPTAAAGGDYVTIWGPIDSPAFAGSGLPRVVTVLRREYESVYDPGPGGMLRVWRRRQPDAIPAPSPH